MARGSDTPQGLPANAVCDRLKEDIRRDDAHSIEGERAISAEATPEEPFKDDHIPRINHIRQQPALDEREGMGVATSDEIQFDFAPIQQTYSNQQYMEPPNTVDMRVVNSPGSTPSSPKVHTPTRASSFGVIGDSAGAGLFHESSVSKTPRRHRPRPVQRRQTHGHDNIRTTQQPSEEDLLFLLMSRARETHKSLERLKFLEHENKNLRQLQGQTDAELQQIAKARDECAQYSDFLSQNLDMFREKYYKLKKWALETNKDCEMLQQKASAFQRTLTDVAKDRDQLLTQLQEVRCSSGSASEQMENIRKGFREAKSIAENSIATIKQLDAFTVAQDEHLRSEKQRCRKLEAHIHHLEQEKNKQSVRFHGQHQVTNQSLQDISKQLVALQDRKAEDNSATARIVECLCQIQSMIDNNLVAKLDLAPLKEDYTSLNTSLVKLEDSLSEKVQAAIANLKHDLQHDVSIQASTLLSEVRSGNIEFVEAKAEVARLEGKTEQTQEIIHLLREAKRDAQKHEAELQETNKNLRNNKEAALVQSEELRTSLRTVTTKWQIACSELEKCRQEKNESHAEVTDLMIRLTEALQEHNSLQAELMASEYIVNESKVQNEQQIMELNHMRAQILDLQGDVDHEIQRRSEIEDEVGRIKAQESQARQDLEKSREETVTAIRQYKDLQFQISALEERLIQADEDSRKLEETMKSLEEAQAELQYLRQEQSSLQALKEESLFQLQQIADKSTEIQTLQKQVEDLRNKSAHLEEQVRGKDRLIEENASIHNDLNDLRGQLSEQEDLQEKFQQKITETAILESALAATQVQTARVGELERRNTSLEESVASLTTDLEQLHKQYAQVLPLQETVKEKDNQITELQKQLVSHSGLTEELKNLKADLQEKEERQAAMQQQILSLEGAISNAKLDDNEASQRPRQRQRRVVDRSIHAKGFHNNQFRHSQSNSDGADAQLFNGDNPLHLYSSSPLSSVMNIVPETQLEVQESLPVEPDSFMLPPGQVQEDSGSELTPIPSDDEKADLEDLINQDVDHSTRRYDRSQIHVWPRKGTNSTRRTRETVERPPSSSYESQSDQMLLDQVSQGESQVPTDFNPTDIGVNFAMPRNRMTSKEGPSPRRLRSELRGRDRQYTASPDPIAESQGHRPSTPAIMRERYQPNSAAKRRMEPDNDEDKASPENPKRLKRRPANIEAKKPTAGTPKQRGEKSSSRPAISFRKSSTTAGGSSSSIVGTNAPGPGKSQRTSKPARKGSRQDKYATRFAAET